jgi:hypothetical protein
MADQYPSDKSLSRTFYDLLQAADVTDKVKRHEALRVWWQKNVITVSSQTTIDYLQLASTNDRLGMIASVWQTNAAKMARKVIEEHGLVQQVPPPEALPTNDDIFFGDAYKYVDRNLTWLTRIHIVKP